MPRAIRGAMGVWERWGFGSDGALGAMGVWVQSLGIDSVGDGVTQLIERRIREPKIGGSNPACVSKRNICERGFFPSQQCCADSLPMCPTC